MDKPHNNMKIEMLFSARSLRDILKSIENLLEGYEGIEGNKNYVRYCHKKAAEAHIVDEVLVGMIEDTFNADISKRRGINITLLQEIVKKQFKLLGDIDTAGDMFKPKWCKMTSAVESLQRLRWLYCTFEPTKRSHLNINGVWFRKEGRVIIR